VSKTNESGRELLILTFNMMCRVTSSKGIVIGASEAIAVALFARIAGGYKRLALVATAGKATTKAVITKSAVLIIDAARDFRFMAGLSFSVDQCGETLKVI
jgi:2-C-methyl-D-erythritol 4-phosphate cytidylyltransferase